MFHKKGIGHASIEGHQGLDQVIPIDDSMVVGSGKVIKRSNPEIRPKSEHAFLARHDAVDFSVSFGIQNRTQNRPQFRHAVPEHLKDSVPVQVGRLRSKLLLWPKRLYGFRSLAIQPRRLPGFHAPEQIPYGMPKDFYNVRPGTCR